MKATGMSKAGRNALGAAVAAALVPAGASAAVGRIDFAYGDVVGVSPAGQERKLVRGAQIEEGDTVVTRRGRAQIRFTDGARTSLLPNSEFRVDRYEYEEQKEEESTGFFSLLRGGLRTITGAIGRLRKEAYQVTTPSATIGIRGTEYLAVIGDSLTVWVAADGAIVLKNNAGQKTFEGGTSAYVKNNDTLAIIVDGKPYLFSYLGNDALFEELNGKVSILDYSLGGFVGTGNVDENGEPEVVTGRLVPVTPPAGTPLPPAPVFKNGEFYSLAVSIGDGVEGAVGAASLVDATFVSGNPLVTGGGDTLVRYNSNPSGVLDGVLSAGTAVDTGNDGGTIGWGRWVEATVEISGTGLSRVGGFSDGTRTLTGSESHHYVVGLPTANMPTTGDFTYDLLGSTPPTYGDGTGIGTLNNASLTAHFDGTTPTVDINMQFSIGGTTPEVYNTSATASISGSQFGASGFLTTDQFSGSYNTLIKGFFAGDQAARAGYVYHVDTSEQVNGAVTFTKGAEVPLSAVTATD